MADIPRECAWRTISRVVIEYGEFYASEERMLALMECATLASFTLKEDPEKFRRLRLPNQGDTVLSGITAVSLQENEESKIEAGQNSLVN